MTHAGQRDPLVNALVELLPSTGETFTTGDRERWVAAMDSALQFLYPPEWAPEARRRAREAREGASIPCVPPCPPEETTDGNGLHFFINVRPPGPDSEGSEFDQQLETIRQHVEGTLAEYREGLTLTLPKEASSTTSADAVDDDSGGEAKSGGGAEPAPDTSSPLSASPAMAPEASTGHSATAPTSPSTDDPAPTPSLAERLEAKGLVSDVEVPGRIDPPAGKRRQFTNRQKANLVRRCVKEGVEVVADAERLDQGTLRRWTREFHQVKLATEESLGIAPAKGRS